MNLSVFENIESEVRSYCRNFPSIFSRGKNALLFDKQGNEYLDFLAGAGSVNYGHNDPSMIEAAIHYLSENGILQGLDMHTEAKETFLTTLHEYILAPRHLRYKVQFTGPTGTNAIEAALKLARKVTGRHTIACFSGGYHGMSLGSLSITANPAKRQSTGLQIPGILRLPYDQFSVTDVGQQLSFIRDMLCKPGNGIDLPAAFILECVQGEGGLNCASVAWLQGLTTLAREIGSLLIIDDIQAGCGRTGNFFSFEEAGITPDIVCISKSISGSGLPMSINLISPDLDKWYPGEHNGTFRGNNLAMTTATVALKKYWGDASFSQQIKRKEQFLKTIFQSELQDLDTPFSIVGKGLMVGIKFTASVLAKKISRSLFERKLLIETCGPQNEVVKCMPPLTIEDERLQEGAERIIAATRNIIQSLRHAETTLPIKKVSL
ncbi:diaminobutyrate--2-oxoglutarate transaminase [Photorhabdus viridis]|uniref:diaminobutyrate--2-oxoglutarate transaminase n=1 Tax=Photorhabdus viridis TaxID=3163327 RepID=UPI003306D93E